MSLVIKNLHANVQGTEILKGINLEIPKGEVHAIMEKHFIQSSLRTSGL